MNVIERDDGIGTKVLIIGGAIALVSGCFMAFKFGVAMSPAHGITLALVGVLAAFMPARIHSIYGMGKTKLAWGLGALCSVFLCAEYFSHLGYTIGNRVESTEQAGFHNSVKLGGAKDQTRVQAADLERWITRQAEATAERSAIVKANPYATQVEPDALLSARDAALKVKANEEARGGCKSKCEARMKEIAAVDEKISTVRKVNILLAEIKDLDGKIAEANALVARSQAAVIQVGYRSSPIISQTKFVGQLWTASLEPDAESLNWTQIAIGAMIALVTTFLAPVAFFLASVSQSNGQPGGKAIAQQATPVVSMRGVPSVFSATASPAIPQNTTTNTISVVDGGGDLVRQITELCRVHTDKVAA